MNIVARFEMGRLCVTMADVEGLTRILVRKEDGSEWKETYPGPPPPKVQDAIDMVAHAVNAAGL